MSQKTVVFETGPADSGASFQMVKKAILFQITDSTAPVGHTRFISESIAYGLWLSNRAPSVKPFLAKPTSALGAAFSAACYTKFQ
jgi:hypothetical protein